MANEYGHLQWTLDTAGVITTDKLRIQKLKWVPSATGGDDLTILDNNDEIIWDANAPATSFATEDYSYELDFGEGGHDFLGFNLSVIDGGTLSVYFK